MPRATFWGIGRLVFVLVAYASLAASRTLLHRSPACLNFTLDSEDLFCWYKPQRWFLWTMAAAQAAEKHGDEWGLAWYLRWKIHTSTPAWTHSQNSLAAAEALILKISSHGTSLKWSQRPFQSARESLQAMWWNGASCFYFDGKKMEKETTWSEFPNAGKAIVKQILAPE